MKYNRLKNTGRNMVWGSVDTLTGIILPFFVRTTLIHTLSMEYVGIGGLFTSILQLLNLTELGIANAITQSLYRPLAEDDKATACALLRYYRSAYRVIGLIVLALGLALLPFLDILVKGGYPDSIRLESVFLIYLLDTVIGYFAFADKKILLIAMQRNDVTNKVAAATKASRGLLQILLLLTLQNYYVYVMVLPLAVLADNLLCAWLARRMYPEYLCKGDLEPVHKRAILKKTKGLLFHKICSSTRNACDSLFLSALFGLATVGIYNNYFYVMNSVRSMLNVVTLSMSSSLGNSIVTESVDHNHSLLHILSFLYAWICGFCTVCLLCLYQPFMSLWIGAEGMFSMDVVIALCIYFYVWTLGDVKSLFSDARGIWWKNRYRTAFEALSNLVLNFLMVRIWGVTGIVLATAVSILFLGLPWSTVILFDDYFGRRRLPRYFIAQLMYAVVTLLSCVLTYCACALVPFHGWAGLILRGTICCILPNVFYLLCYHRLPVFSRSVPYVLRLLRISPRKKGGE